MNIKIKTNNLIKETISMKNIFEAFKSFFHKIKDKLQFQLREDDLNLYEFEQIELKKSYRPIREPWEQL